jgi:PAS domain S-box-containing protein
MGFVTLLLMMQWTAQEGRKHIRIASQFLFPAALESQDAATVFQGMTRQYGDAVVMQEKSSLAGADRDAAAAMAALDSARISMAFDRMRQRQISSLMAQVESFYHRSKPAYAESIDSQGALTVPMQAKLADLARENKDIQSSLRMLQNDLANDFRAELGLIDKWSEIERASGIALFVIVIAALFFSTRALTNIAAQRRTDEVLRQAHKETEVLLNSVPSLLIGLDPNGRIRRWNKSATAILGWDERLVLGKTLSLCGVNWLTPDIDARVTARIQNPTENTLSDIKLGRGGATRFLGLNALQVKANDGTPVGSLVVGADITEKTILEGQLRQAHKLEAIGQLAAGIAHEINTPTQFVASNASFLKESWNSIAEILDFCRVLPQELAEKGSISGDWHTSFDQLLKRSDLNYLVAEVPKAIDQSLEGLQRITNIVRAMKEFSHPGSEGKSPIDINRAIDMTIAVAKNEWKYVADVITQFGDDLPAVPCVQGEFNQVILNLLVNAAQAIADVASTDPNKKGTITITTRRAGETVEIAIHDTGAGIPENVRSRIFEPFFTTKPVGKGTGQGLALAYSTIVKRHQGRIWFETEAGQGTTFIVQLPLEAQSSVAAGA